MHSTSMTTQTTLTASLITSLQFPVALDVSLVVHGKHDQRVPVGQATGFFHELRRRGLRWR